MESLYARLPECFDAEAVGDAARADRSSLSGNRRHLVLRHLVEHPAFDCELVARQPLTARKDELSCRNGERAARNGELPDRNAPSRTNVVDQEVPDRDDPSRTNAVDQGVPSTE